MIHRPRAISDDIRAENIESGNDVVYRGLVGAIVHVTRSDLENLGQAYKEAQGEMILKNAQIAQSIILQAFIPIIPNANCKGGNIEFELSLEIKEKLKGILPAIQYLYTMRYGEMKGGEFNTLLNTDRNEPYLMIFELEGEAGGKFFIKKMLLKKSNENTDDEGKDK